MAVHGQANSVGDPAPPTETAEVFRRRRYLNWSFAFETKSLRRKDRGTFQFLFNVKSCFNFTSKLVILISAEPLNILRYVEQITLLRDCPGHCDFFRPFFRREKASIMRCSFCAVFQRGDEQLLQWHP